MARKIKRRKTRSQLRNDLERLLDQINDLKQDRNLIDSELDDKIAEAKVLFRKLPENEMITDFSKAIYEDFDQDRVDWKALAMSFKPHKRRVKKFTTSQRITRLKTFDLFYKDL